MKANRHYLILGLILILGAALRFWHLDSKPIWSDEVLTALFSLGRSFNDVPLNQALPILTLQQVFRLNPEATCPQIVETVSIQSVHPPLFFCWMHQWLTWTDGLPQSWVWKLRALPAIFGVLTIAAIYQLNRVAFSPLAGLIGAALMAVSPFAVYLSQEARHYTLPMLLVTLALLGLYQLQVDLYHQRFRPAIWLAWVGVNSLGFYVHYFFLLAFIAQSITLVANFLSLKCIPSLHPDPVILRTGRSLGAIALAISGVCLTLLLWLPTLISHLTRPETDWLKTSTSSWQDAIEPLYQLPLGWILMVVALPAESKIRWIAALSGFLMVVFSGWLVWQVSGRFWQLWRTPQTRLTTQMLIVFILVVLLEFLGIIYLLDKDLTQVPRYNFIYYPAICALLGASLTQQAAAREVKEFSAGRPKSFTWNLRSRLTPEAKGAGIIVCVVLVGILSSAMVVSNQAFQKPYQPEQVAQNILIEPEKPLFTSLAYNDFQDVALGLSFALAIGDEVNRQSNWHSQNYFAFVARSPNYGAVWQKLNQLKLPLLSPLNFWMIAPGLRQADFPKSLALFTQQSSGLTQCAIDSQNYHRIGVPYQMYRCQ